MGTSTDGILVYGIAFEDEEMPGFLEPFEGDFDEYCDSISGLPKYGEEGHSFAADRAFRETQPADLTLHCSYECPMYILAVRGTKKKNSRGYCTEITSLDVEPEKVEAFKAWCRERGIEDPQPKWLLVSMWG